MLNNTKKHLILIKRVSSFYISQKNNLPVLLLEKHTENINIYILKVKQNK